MPPLRPTPSLTRPSIYELATSLLSPSTCHARLQSLRSIRAHSQLASVRPGCSAPLPRACVGASKRAFTHTTRAPKAAPKSHDRGPVSSETTQTSFESMDVLGNTPAPGTAIDACLWDGFHLDNGYKVHGGSGALLVSGEVFEWKPWECNPDPKRMVNTKGQWEVGDEAWGLFKVVWPKPDLLIIGLGKDMRPLSPATRRYINSLGIRIEVQDTRNAAAQFNLLATERGVGSVAAAMIPLGWREGVGIKLAKGPAEGTEGADESLYL
ncbi:hypothetical protein BP5796_00538 [Coleophoma crateriformis]|uniref:NADH dehydrogenase [ubiquinone] 1 alpha subcomplex assembly factor 3 n=1 Tax=Coleophoma crateriformis TaxID=565419 RepID=A0A3D8T8C3_9HELO|nr:hypothetical protein BP5796_00538 [Coleophoma crateriformis]